MIMDDLCPGRSGELVTGLAEQADGIAWNGKAHRGPVRDIVDDAQDTDDRRRQDRHLTGLVVEANVAASHRRAQLTATVNQTTDGLGELPHHRRILRGPEVEA